MSLTKIVNLQRRFSSFCLTSNGRSSLLAESKLKPVRDVYKVIYYDNCKMSCYTLEPPDNLHGTKVLNREAFNKTVVVLAVETEDVNITRLRNQLKQYILKLFRVKPIQDTEKENIKRLLFNPNKARKRSDFDAAAQKLFEELNLNEDRFVDVSLSLGYDNWTCPLALKAVLPVNEPPLTSFSIIGHIVHVNLKPHLLEYKGVIGEILLDKVSGIRTVINKSNRIENVYRNFDIDLICGEPDYIVTAKENGCNFKFDFSKVYWNPRLGTEHARVIDTLKYGDVFFDVFCGVGPFSLPAAKKKCKVYANDLNPESVKWLLESLKLNKVSSEYLEIFNKDASEFISIDVKKNLLQLWKDEMFANKIYVAMNLPALGLEFLKCFKGLIKSDEIDIENVRNNLPVVYCYFFALNSDDPNSIKDIIMQRSDFNVNKYEHSIHFVRNVASGMEMLKLNLELPLEYLVDSSNVENYVESCEEPQAKKICKSD